MIVEKAINASLDQIAKCLGSANVTLEVLRSGNKSKLLNKVDIIIKEQEILYSRLSDVYGVVLSNIKKDPDLKNRFRNELEKMHFEYSKLAQVTKLIDIYIEAYYKNYSFIIDEIGTNVAIKIKNSYPYDANGQLISDDKMLNRIPSIYMKEEI